MIDARPHPARGVVGVGRVPRRSEKWLLVLLLVVLVARAGASVPAAKARALDGPTLACTVDGSGLLTCTLSGISDGSDHAAIYVYDSSETYYTENSAWDDANCTGADWSYSPCSAVVEGTATFTIPTADASSWQDDTVHEVESGDVLATGWEDFASGADVSYGSNSVTVGTTPSGGGGGGSGDAGALCVPVVCAADGTNTTEETALWDLLRSGDTATEVGSDGASIEDYYGAWDNAAAVDASDAALYSAEADASMVPDAATLLEADPITMLAGAGAILVYDLTDGTHHHYYTLHTDDLGGVGVVNVGGLPSGWNRTVAAFAWDPDVDSFVLEQGWVVCPFDGDTCGGEDGTEYTGGWGAVGPDPFDSFYVPALDDSPCAGLPGDVGGDGGDNCTGWADSYQHFGGTELTDLNLISFAALDTIEDVYGDASTDVGMQVGSYEALLGGSEENPCGYVDGTDLGEPFDCVMLEMPLQGVLKHMGLPSLDEPDGAEAVYTIPWTPPASSPDPTKLALALPALEADPCLENMLNHYLDASYPLVGCTDATTTGALTLPEPTTTNQTCEDYVTYLATLGYTGDASCVSLPEQDTSPLVGPSAPVRIKIENPAPSGLPTPAAIVVGVPFPGDPSGMPTIDPNATLQISKNPDDAPPATGSPGQNGVGATGGSCTCPPLDLTPLTSISYGTQFPFGVFGWLSTALGSMTSESAQPIEFHVGLPGGGTQDVTLASSTWTDTWRPIVFPVFEFLITLAAVWFVAYRILGLRGGE